MIKNLLPSQITSNISREDLNFNDTSSLAIDQLSGWIGQSEAESAAKFGLAMQHSGYNLIVLGQPGSGRTTLLMSAMKAIAKTRLPAHDLAMLHDFDSPDKPLVINIKSGRGVEFRLGTEQLIRWLIRKVPAFLSEAGLANAEATDKSISSESRLQIEQLLFEQLETLSKLAEELLVATERFSAYMLGLKKDVLENLEVFIPNPDGESLLESFLARYRMNLMVDNRAQTFAPVIYDADPTYQSLFGGYEGNAENSSGLDFLRLRAGNVLRANGGMLMLQLRDILADQANGSQILEKLFRVLRNRAVQIEESSGGGGQNAASHFSPESLPVEVKLVLIASGEDYYSLIDEMPEFSALFPVKVEFAQRFEANADSYQMLSLFIAKECHRLLLPPVHVDAVIEFIKVMKRQVEDQHRISANFKFLQGLLLECATWCAMREGDLILASDVQSALVARYKRHQSAEHQMLEAMKDGEVLLSLTGEAIGQVNGLTHIDLGDTSFGSPIRITARAFAGDQGVVNIDREVEMTGPNHDKGVFILKSWLSASFVELTPLSLNASIVFEQEYHGVEGDSASCAELFALLSAMSHLPLAQGIAVTGALNQHGEVMPIGGVNDKIEGYFRVCKAVGLNGKQGVMIPARNVSHLILGAEVVHAVEQGLFHIYAIDHVLDGMEILTGELAGEMRQDGTYASETIMGRVEQTLKKFREFHFVNRVVDVRRA